jgi:predicted tellurium resistance membrane protein TerC
VLWTASAFALLPARSRRLLVRRLSYLDETIALILGFVGIKILTADLVQIGSARCRPAAAASGFVDAASTGSLVSERGAPR